MGIDGGRPRYAPYNQDRRTRKFDARQPEPTETEVMKQRLTDLLYRVGDQVINKFMKIIKHFFIYRIYIKPI